MSLVKVLREALVPDLIAHPDAIGLASPSDRGDMILTVFLYEIKENTEHRTSDMIDQGGELRYPPIALDLSYLITAHSSSDAMTRAIDEHRIIGRTMQVLHDHNVLKGEDLTGSLAGSGETFRITKTDLPLEAAANLFPDKQYKLSLGYSIGPVYLDSTRTRSVSRVRERQVRVKRK
jgi:hypothetical protein